MQKINRHSSTQYVYTLYRGAFSDDLRQFDAIDSIDGSSLPMYRTIIANGGDATTALTAQTESWTIGPPRIFSGTDDSDPFMRPFESSNWGDPSALKTLADTAFADVSTLEDDANAIALSNAQSKIQDFNNPFQGQVFLGELKETIDLLKHPLEGSLGLLRALLNKRFSTRKVVSSASEAWLEFRFGILPLVADIRSILELANRKAALNTTVQFKSFGKSVRTFSSAQDVVTVSGVILPRQQEWKRTVEVYYHFGILASHLDRVNSLSEGIQDILSPKYIVPTAWELIPFSFLIDYFANVGDIISATFSGNFNTSYCSKSVIQTRECVWQFSIPVPANSNIHLNPPPVSPVYRYKRRSVSRGKGVLGIPPLTFHLPGSDIRKLNIAALLGVHL